MNHSLIDEDTVVLTILPKVTRKLPVTMSILQFPQLPVLYIIAPKLQGMEVYDLEKAPSWSFDAWCCAVANGGIVYDFAQTARDLNIDRSRWNTVERWTMVNALAENLGKIGVVLPLYTSHVGAQRALIAMEVPRW